jgi:hypothetical protein
LIHPGTLRRSLRSSLEKSSDATGYCYDDAAPGTWYRDPLP